METTRAAFHGIRTKLDADLQRVHVPKAGTLDALFKPGGNGGGGGGTAAGKPSGG
ncbi:Kinesin heavy chain [Micractinium conductrix]|uniref:Kinesin heavy chain n=1 Tax=Micractinium conductrix TaxID=554055 RepID=A0A2P6V7Q7_9CHLO|nr:Kinesin heavy chain [Micractinium conductrix]|eukprot:PSC70119.1 Kinesin heavy chain [Micractinium conductrix]